MSENQKTRIKTALANLPYLEHGFTTGDVETLIHLVNEA